MARNPEKPNDSDDDDKSEDERPRRRGAIQVPLEVTGSEKPRRSVLDEALAELAIRKQAKKESAKTSEPDPVAAAEDEATTSDATAPAAETAQEATAEPAASEHEDQPEEHLVSRELRADELSYGEGVISLQDKSATSERGEIPLHPISAEAASSQPEPELTQEAIAEPEPAAAEPVEATPAEVVSAPNFELPTVPSPEYPDPVRPVVEAASFEPARSYREYAQQTANVQTIATEPLITKREADDAAYRAEKAGLSRGVVTGLLVGGTYEHLKHKHREKRLRKQQALALKKQSKLLDQAIINKWSQPAQERFAPPAQPELSKPSAAITPERTLKKRFEKLLPKKLENTPVTLEQLQIPKDHHIETSAWHSIEVDSKTGKAVENPTFIYGREYHRERAQEAGPRDKLSTATGEVALVAAAMDQPAGPPPNTTTSQAAPQNATGRKPIERNSVKSMIQPIIDSSSGPLWPWVVALVVIVICLAVLIR